MSRVMAPLPSKELLTVDELDRPQVLVNVDHAGHGHTLRSIWIRSIWTRSILGGDFILKRFKVSTVKRFKDRFVKPVAST